MPNQLGIVHPDMFAALQPNFYPSLLTVQAGTEVRSPTGAITTTWDNVSGSINLPCRIAPASGSETRTPTQVVTQDTQICVVPAYLPTITTKQRVLVDGEPMNIISVDYDGQNLPGLVKRSTRLTLKVVS